MGTALNLASAYSITQLTLNAIGACMLIRKARLSGETAEDHPGLVPFAVGLILFWCCDVCVGIFNISAGLPALKSIGENCGFLIWIFYLPSQVLLVLSEMRFLSESADRPIL